MQDLQTGWKMSRCIGTSTLNHVWRMKCWREPNPETHEKNRRMGHSSPWSFCVLAAWLGGEKTPWGWTEPGGCCVKPPCSLPFALWGLHEPMLLTIFSCPWMAQMR